jgi:hypothetical protein
MKNGQISIVSKIAAGVAAIISFALVLVLTLQTGVGSAFASTWDYRDGQDAPTPNSECKDFNNLDPAKCLNQSVPGSGLLGTPASKVVELSEEQKRVGALSVGDIPDHYFFNEEHPDWVTPVMDQDRWGTCWAFGTAAAIEGAIQKADNKSLNGKHVSTDNIVKGTFNEDTLTFAEPLTSDEGYQNGGSVRYVRLATMKGYGIDEEERFPYLSWKDEFGKDYPDWLVDYMATFKKPLPPQPFIGSYYETVSREEPVEYDYDHQAEWLIANAALEDSKYTNDEDGWWDYDDDWQQYLIDNKAWTKTKNDYVDDDAETVAKHHTDITLDELKSHHKYEVTDVYDFPTPYDRENFKYKFALYRNSPYYDKDGFPAFSEFSMDFSEDRLKAIKADIADGNILAMEYRAADMNNNGSGALDQYWNNATDAQYIPLDSLFQNKLADHVTAIVGYDDNYSADNFAVKPPHNGAFLVKNSWTSKTMNHTTDKDDGYFWLSYYDVSISSVAHFNARTTDFDKLEILDNSGYMPTDDFDAPSDQVSIANVFTAEKAESVKGIQYSTSHVGQTVSISLYKNVDPTSTLGPKSGVLVPIGAAGETSITIPTPYSGMHTAQLPVPATIAAGDHYAAVITITDDSEADGVTTFGSETDDADATSGTDRNVSLAYGESFISINGNDYYDWKSYQGARYSLYKENPFVAKGNFVIRADVDFI